MADRIPIVVNGGEMERLQSGDTLVINGTYYLPSGDVGFGASAPDVYGFGAGVNYFTFKSRSTNIPILFLIENGTGTGGTYIQTGNTSVRRSGIAFLDGGHIVFNTNATNTGTNITEKVRICGSGGVHIGGTADPGASNLRVVGAIGVGMTPDAAAGYVFEATGSNSSQTTARIQSTASAGVAAFNTTNSGGTIGEFGIRGPTRATYGALVASDAYVYGSGSITIMADNASGVIRFAAGGNSERMRLTASGGLHIGGTTDLPVGCLRVNQTLTFPPIASPSAVSGHVLLHGANLSSVIELRVLDSAGNGTYLSPHASDSPIANIDDDIVDMVPIVIRHENDYLGNVEWVHLSAMARALEDLTGKKFTHMQKGKKQKWDREDEIPPVLKKRLK